MLPVSYNPVNDAHGVAVGTSFVLTFACNIKRGVGHIYLKKGGSTVQTYHVESAKELVYSGNTLTIKPNPAPEPNTDQYMFQISSGTIVDRATGEKNESIFYSFDTIPVEDGDDMDKARYAWMKQHAQGDAVTIAKMPGNEWDQVIDNCMAGQPL